MLALLSFKTTMTPPPTTDSKPITPPPTHTHTTHTHTTTTTTTTQMSYPTFRSSLTRKDSSIQQHHQEPSPTETATISKVPILLPRYANRMTWFRLPANQIVGFLIGPMPKPCMIPAPTTVKLPHSSSHSSGNPRDTWPKQKSIPSKFDVAFTFINGLLLLVLWHHLYIFS